MSVWDRFPEYDDNELRELTKVTASVLVDSCSEPVALNQDVLDLPPLALSRQIAFEFSDIVPQATPETIQKLLESEAASREVSLALLGKIREIDPLSSLISEAYEEHRRRMAGPELLLAIGALIILAIKVKKLKISKEGVELQFSMPSSVLKEFIASFLKGVNGSS
jgi:hypothetical protein